MILRDAHALKALMTDRDMTGARLSRAAGVSRQFIHQLSTGKRHACRDHVAALIAAALGVPLETLFMPEATRLVSQPETREGVAA